MRSSSKKRWSIAANIILSICSFLAIMPFLLLIIASLTDDTVAMTDGYSYFPAKWSLSAYEYIANQAEMIGRAYFMTIIHACIYAGTEETAGKKNTQFYRSVYDVI